MGGQADKLRVRLTKERGRETDWQAERESDVGAPNSCLLSDRQSSRPACDWMAAGGFVLSAVHVWMGIHLPRQPFDTMRFSEGEDERA